MKVEVVAEEGGTGARLSIVEEVEDEGSPPGGLDQVVSGGLVSRDVKPTNHASPPILDPSDSSSLHYEQYEFNDGVTYHVVQAEEALDGGTGGGGAASGANFQSTPPQPVQALYSTPLNGIYVIRSAHDVFPLSTQKAIVPRNYEENSRAPVTRDDKRRQTHNEVERRRRDKINSWIMKLSKIIPECKNDTAKGTFESQSKGGILAKACDYIVELRDNNSRLMMCAKENEQLSSEVDTLNRRIEELKIENQTLRSVLQQHAIPLP